MLSSCLTMPPNWCCIVMMVGSVKLWSNVCGGVVTGKLVGSLAPLFLLATGYLFFGLRLPPIPQVRLEAAEIVRRGRDDPSCHVLSARNTQLVGHLFRGADVRNQPLARADREMVLWVDAL